MPSALLANLDVAHVPRVASLRALPEAGCLLPMRDASVKHKARISPDSDSETLSHWVKLAFMAMRRETDAALRRSGMTLTQWRALGMLLHNPGMTHSELVQKLEIEAPSVTSLVNGMERRGWVRRARSAGDARVKQLYLTPRGRRLIEEARGLTAPVEHRMTATLSAGERATLRRLLRTMVEGMR